MKLEKYKCTKEEFLAMTKMEQRTYILQENQEETNWWLGFMAKISVITFFVGLALAALTLATS
jgi:hypothetical protein